MSATDPDTQDLFRRFSGPLNQCPALARLDRRVVEKLAESLWKAMIDGPDMEKQTWDVLRQSDGLTEVELEAAHKCYAGSMKPVVTAEQLVRLRESEQSGEERTFAVGDRVRVRYGVPDPDYPDLPVGGWAGTITEIGDDGICTIRLNQQTLDNIHPIYRKRCERDELIITELGLRNGDLEPDLAEPVPLEQPTNPVTRPLDPKDQDDRIRAALGLTTDDRIPVVDEATLVRYRGYLKAELTFPFEAAYWYEGDWFASRRCPVSVTGLLDTVRVEESGGVLCEASDGRHRRDVPLADLDVAEDHPNHQLLDDYASWFYEWGAWYPPVFWEEEEEEEEDEQEQGQDDQDDWLVPQPIRTGEKVGRNDPCPCGSGKKFKKCCLKKQDHELFSD